jgi:phosphatidylserine decarboxylase
MNLYPHPIIAREGWTHLAIATLIALALTYCCGWWSLPAWAAVIFVLQFFRDPARIAPEGFGLVLAPADGRVIKVEKVHDPYLNRDALLISIFMNVFNVHSNRSPVDGAVENLWYFPGKFVNADLDKASSENERNAMHIKTSFAADVICVQVAGLIARRILCYVKQGDQLTRGQRYGFIRFGSRVDVYLPPDAIVKTSIGDKVSATTTVIASLAQG